MAAPQNQRLRKASQKASQRKAIVAEKRRLELTSSRSQEAQDIKECSQAPVKACLMPENLFIEGMGWIVLGRQLPSRMIGVSFFLVDSWCLGVKNTFFSKVSPAEFEEYASAYGTHILVEADPSVARKLLHDAAAYAASFGIAPCKDFAMAESLFGDVKMAGDTFDFGRDGEPFFAPGPSDSPAKVRRILKAIEDWKGRTETRAA